MILSREHIAQSLKYPGREHNTQSLHASSDMRTSLRCLIVNFQIFGAVYCHAKDNCRYSITVGVFNRKPHGTV
jgi:hypothetical protein